jgi:hypothetical protein
MKHGTPSQANRGPKNPGRSHRPKALEAQRLLITQSISITENEKVTVPG